MKKILAIALFATSAFAQYTPPSGGGSVTTITGTGPITATGTTSVTIACPTCATAASGGSLTTIGAYGITFTATGATTLTLPASGTLVNSAVTTLGSLSLPYSQVTGGPTVTGGTCTNQVVTAISSSAVPTCTTLTNAYGNLVTWTNFGVTIANGGPGAITMTTPSTSFTAARTDAANTFSGAQTFGGLITAGGSTASTLRTITGNTTDGSGIGLLLTGTASDTSSDTANGVEIGLIHNSSSNRQIFIGDSGNGIGFRFFEGVLQGWASGNTSNIFIGDGSHTVYIGEPSNATSGTNQSPPGMSLQSAYWNGTASTSDVWNMSNTLGTGTNPTSTLTFSHSGSSGTASISTGGNPLIYNVNSPPTNSVVCYKAGGVLGYATNSAGVIGTTCN